MKFLFSALLVFISIKISYCEIYAGITPSLTLSDVKVLFPNAKFEKLKPSWLNEKEALYAIENTKLKSTIVVRLTGNRDYYKKQLMFLDSMNAMDKLTDEEIDDFLSIDTGRGITYEMILESYYKQISRRFFSDGFKQASEKFRQLYNRYTDDSMKVVRVRSIPDSIIFVKDFILKYGNPDNTSFSNEDLAPYKYWKRGVAVCYDEKEIVKYIDYYPTFEDEKNAYLKKNNLKVLPQYMNDLLQIKYFVH